jgi:class 3 adenylate cyclase
VKQQDPRPGSLAARMAVVHSAAPWAVRTVVGLVTVVLGANLVGGAVITFLLAALNTRAPQGQRVTVLTFSLVYVALALVAGTVLSVFVHRRTLAWLLRGREPSAAEAGRAVRAPLDLAVITGAFWFIGAAAIGSLVWGLGGGTSVVLEVASGLVLGGLTTAGVTYVLVSRLSRPITQLALSTDRQASLTLSVRSRLLLLWLLTAGIPILGIILILAAPEQRSHVRGAGVGLGIVALCIGVLSNVLAARTIGAPLRDLAIAVRRIGEGDLDTEVVVDDAGEIGMLQQGVNEMSAALRERDRLNDLFGRHVGTSVAEQALQHGVTFSGECRDVVALFVDITGSTALARTTDPQQMVEMLNRFFGIVVDAVEEAGGLVNKFEGDAALCVFGAPVELPHAETAALCTARRIRDEVLAAREVDIGIGVSAGRVVAGQIGAPTRLEYTVIGDAVNEAARLTTLAKQCPGRVLASQAVVDAADPDEQRFWTQWQTVTLRGRDRPTVTWTALSEGSGREALVTHEG